MLKWSSLHNMTRLVTFTHLRGGGWRFWKGWYWKKNIRSLEKKFTFPGKNIYSPWKRNLGSSGPVVLWSCGPLVLWSCGPLVLWSCGPGPLVLWSSGPLVLWFWSCGHVVPWQRHEKKYVRTKKAWKECKRKWRKRRSGTINKYSFNNN